MSVDTRPADVAPATPSGDGARAAGATEVWAARVWNVFNEGKPFSIVFPPMVLGAATVMGLAPEGSLSVALAGALAVAVPLSLFAFPLRWRVLLWLSALASVPLLEPWRAPGMMLGALAGYVFFTIVLWGSIYYHLRTGAPWANGLRFWRLVVTNSDPTSGNALEQVPKWLLALSAATLLAEEPTGSSILRIAAVVVLTCVGGWVAWRHFARDRLPSYPAADGDAGRAWSARPALSRRVYVVVVDGANRGRLWQARTPTIDKLAREGTEYLSVEPVYPARTVVCFSSMLTGSAPHEHGMRSNFAPRLGVRTESVFDVLERNGRHGRLVGIAHLLDPFRGTVVRSVTSVQPTERIDHSLTAAARRVVEDEDPDLLVLQLLAADQLGHVRGTRNAEYLDQMEETDRRIGDFLAFLSERGKLDDATVVLMADHGQGRGIGGHGHMDWGERPVPFVVWGNGAVPGAVSRERRSVCELAPTISRLLGVEQPLSARGRALVPVEDRGVRVPAAEGERRCVAVVVARDEEPRLSAVLARMPGEACGMAVDQVVVDDGSRDLTPDIAATAGAHVISHAASRGLGAALRTGLEYARDEGYAAAVYIDGDGEYDSAELARVLDPVARGRADYVIGSRFLERADGRSARRGMAWHRNLANRSSTAALATLMGGLVFSDAQSGFRAFSADALRVAEISHDYNYAQVLTLSLWGSGVEPVEVPITYRRRDGGRSFVRYPEYLARVAPAAWRQWRASVRARAAMPQAMPMQSAYGHKSSPKNGNSSVSGPNGASGRPAASPPPAKRTST